MPYEELDAMIELLLDMRALTADLSDEEIVHETRCPPWRVAELIGHCEGMLLALVGESARAVDGPPQIDRYDVYRRPEPGELPVAGNPGESDDRVVFDRVVDRAVHYTSGRRPAQVQMSFMFIIDGVIRTLPEIPADRVVIRPAAHPPMTHRELVASRLVEFGMHISDIAAAVGRSDRIPPGAAAVVTNIIDELLGETPPAALGWAPTDYILAATGRRALTPTEREVLGPLADRFLSLVRDCEPRPLLYWG
jgi:uncharacterized protein (TIGR03083 family)